MSHSSDVLVIGGGIVGAATCYYLATAGLSVTLLERAEPGGEATGSNQGNVNFQSKIGGALEPLSELSRRLYDELEQELGTSVQRDRTGGLILCETEDQARQALAHLELHGGRGPRATYMDSSALRRLVPSLACDVVAALLCESDFQVNPMRLVAALLSAAVAAGARVLPFTEVTGLEISNNRCLGAITQEGRFPGGAVVLAAGARSAGLAAMAGVELPVRPRRGQIIVTEPVAPLGIPFLIEMGYMAASSSHAQQLPQDSAASEPRVAFVYCQRDKGNILIGSSSEFAGFENRVTSAVLSALVSRACHFLPWLDRLNCIRAFAGLRPSTPDALPILGPIATGRTDLFVATGHEGSGMSLGPASGKVIADLITHQRSSIDLDRFAPDRFRRTRYA